MRELGRTAVRRRPVALGLLLIGGIVAQLALAGTDLRAAPRTTLQTALRLRDELRSDGPAARRLAEWRRESPRSIDIAVVGDSIARGMPTESFGVPRERSLERGGPGETSLDVAARLEEVLRFRPRKLVLQVGTNDLTRGLAPDAVAERVAAMLRTTRRLSPGSQVIVLAVPPASPWRAAPRAVSDLNVRLRDEAGRAGEQFVDSFAVLSKDDGTPRPHLTTDGIHLTPEAYRRVVELLEPVLRR